MSTGLIICEELCGMEFDWFAVDLSGRVALFSTAGSGLIPACIAPHIDEYLNVSVPNAGQGDAPWMPLAKAGLSVFDNFDSDAYSKQVDGVGDPKEKLWRDLANLPNLLRYDGYFESVGVISDMSAFSMLGSVPEKTPYKAAPK